MQRKSGRRAVIALVAACVAIGLLAGCQASGRSSDVTGTTQPDATTQSDGLHPVDITAAAGAELGPATGKQLNVPTGWTAQVWADVGSARIEAWTSDGRLLVTTDQRGQVVALRPSTTEGAAPAVQTVAEGLDRPQGIATAISAGTEYVVVGEQTRIVRYRWVGDQLVDPVTLADGLPGGGLHYGKFVVVHDGDVYFSIGTASDNDPVDRTGAPERGVIEKVSLTDGSAATPFARGVRNGEGLSFAPDGTLFSAVNQVNNPAYPYHRALDGASDAFGQAGTSWVQDNPDDQITRVTQGSDLGWPYCIPVGEGSAPTDLSYVNDPVTNADGAQLDCGALPTVQVGLPGHSAPIGFHFLTDSSLPASLRSGALVVTHGSYQRNPPRAPGIWTMAWLEQTQTLGGVQPLVSGWQDDAGQRWGRPVDAVPGPDGALYVSDDQAGLIYRLVPPTS